MHPSFLINLAPMQRCHEERGEFDLALAAARRAQFAWLPPAALDDMAAGLAKEGAAGYWRTQLQWAKRWDQQDTHGTYYVAAYMAQTGDIDGAFAQLHRAIDKHDLYLMHLPTDPLFKSLRGDPRWAPTLKRVNLQ
ncbi:MAG: hypothetical protein JNJ55_01225 [Betaproteobacteria bacterium]|nr:hypothetical protein [Betaproteobacteria bacterium]